MNASVPFSSDLPPLPPYQTTKLQPLLLWIDDSFLAVALPVVAYWLVSGIFQVIDSLDLFPQYRLHTPAELLSRNHASRWEVLRDVLLQQVLQTIVGLLLTVFDPEPVTGKEEYDVQVWAQRLRWTTRAVPHVLALVGLDSKGLVSRLPETQWQLAGVLRGGYYPDLLQTIIWDGLPMSAPAFAPWEMSVAKFIYWAAIPALQFAFAVFVLDTWQYFWHRWMHLNKWLYTTLHSRHHRLYVPYAYGALYNHPAEGLLLDIFGAGIAYLVSGMTVRQSMVFYTFSTMKTVDDHCGYKLPFDPLQLITGNNAAYHDIHHQSWGIKTNFSQPFFTVWDRFMGTMWAGGDVSRRYERTRKAAAAKFAMAGSSASHTSPEDSLSAPSEAPYELDPIAAGLVDLEPAAPDGKAKAQAAESRRQVLEDNSHAGGPRVLVEEAAEEQREAKAATRRSPRKKSSASTAESLKGLKERASNMMHGSVGGVLVKDAGH